jgi:hypothetical protein
MLEAKIIDRGRGPEVAGTPRACSTTCYESMKSAARADFTARDSA